jgi:Fe-S cluster biogenesis protein NfuA
VKSLVKVSPTPNPKTFMYSVSNRTIPRSVVSQISQHGSVSDIHQINDSSLAITFFQQEAVLSSVRDEIQSQLWQLLELTPSATLEIEIKTDAARREFDPSTPAGKVSAILEERIRPGVNADGGDIELVELTDDGVAIVRLMGSCNGCPSSSATLKNAIEKTLLFFCPDEVKEVRQAPSETATISSEDVIPAMSTAGADLPSVISHNHVGQPLSIPFNGTDFPVVSLFARQIDPKMIQRVRFTSTVNIPKNSKAAMDVWVNCGDCGSKKRLEDVDQLIRDAKGRMPTVDRVAVIICPACAVVVKEV